MSQNILNLKAGELLDDRYHIIKELGRNIGRRTLLAQNVKNEQLVVLKILSFNNHFSWVDLKLFQREAELLKSLSHPAIPQYIEYFDMNTSSWKGFVLVQTFIEASSLQEHLKTGRTFSELEVKQLAKSLLLVLDYLHSQESPVIHRDIKPSNILLANRSAHSVGDIYLVDFGSVQTLSHEVGTMTIVGTYGYMPPEQFVGKAFPASDLYSLGVTLIHLVSGIEPADLPQEDLQIEFEDEVKNISSEFKAWLKLITNSHLKKRFTSAQEALQVLEFQHLSVTNTDEQMEQKPFDSKVLIIKNVDKLEIIIDYTTYNKKMKCPITSRITKNYHVSWMKKIFNYLYNIIILINDFCIMLFFASILCISWVLVIVFLFQAIYWLFSLPFNVVIATIAAFGLVFAAIYYLYFFDHFIDEFFQSIDEDSRKMEVSENIKSIDSLSLQINLQEISLVCNYTSKSKDKETYTFFQEPKENICELIFQKKSYEYLDEDETEEIPAKLFFRIANKKYGFGYKLTQRELYGLSQEISEFLGKEIIWE